MTQEVTNYARFYAILKTMKLTGDGEELKRDIVRQYTANRTDSLREMTLKEYDECCDGMERMYGARDAYRDAIRRQRATALHLMQKIGIDTTDWARINNFCRHPRLCGKDFARLDGDELDELTVKLRIIKKKGGLKPCPGNDKQGTPVYVITASETTTN